MKEHAFEILLLGIFCSISGCMVGLYLSHVAWAKDCETLGMHRINDRVFICEVKK